MPSPGGIRDRTLEVQKTVAAAEEEAKKAAAAQKRKNFFMRKFSKKSLKAEDENLMDTMDDFLENIEKMKQKIATLKTTSDNLIALDAEMANSPFQKNWRKEEIETKAAQVNQLSKTIHSELKEMEGNLKIGKEAGKYSAAEANIRTTQYTFCLKEFGKTTEGYQIQIANSRDKYLANISKRLQIAGSSKSPEEVEAMLEKGNWSVFTDGLLMETQAAKDQLNQIQDRYDVLLGIEKSIQELNSLFVEIALQVQEQGETIDSIEFHVNATAESTGKGQKELEKAEKSKRKWRKRKCILITVGAVVLVVVVVVVCVG